MGEGAMNGRGASAEEALELARTAELDELLLVAGRVRAARFGRTAHCCSILSVKTGRCSEDCAFCAQSAHYRTEAETSEIPEEEAVRAAARRARLAGASGFGLVASGCVPGDEDLAAYCRLGRIVREEGVALHASLGILDPERARALREAGVTVYNHNLETARSHFPKICSTHDYDRRLRTVRVLKEAGIERCCGGIFGVGETWEQRAELGAELAGLGVERVPVNFLHPIPGTPMADRPLLSAGEALRIVAVFRLMMPAAKIQVCGGREKVLGPMQSWIFAAGATGMILGDYLATAGQAL
ncbi:MAG: biotin synthase BioB, partial [Planctomycetota bacterium]